jgi:hypothetical protein
MRSDGPIVPDLGWDELGAAPDLGVSGATPIWPRGSGHPQHAHGPHRVPAGSVSAAVLVASLGANVVLVVSLLSLLPLSHAGAFAPGDSTRSTGLSASGTALRSPTATSSPTPLSGWLQVTPSSVHLGCAAGQRMQFVVLENTGPQSVHWQAVLSGSAEQTRVAVNPTQGDLDAGASLPLHLQNTTHASDAQGASSQQGVIRFAPAAAEAGSPSSLGYTTVGC